MEWVCAFMWVVSLIGPTIYMFYVIILRTIRREISASIKHEEPEPELTETEQRLIELRLLIKSSGTITPEQYQEFTKLTGTSNASEWGLF